MKKKILALAATALLPLVASAAEPDAASPSSGATPAPARLAPKTVYGDVAKVLTAKPVYERAPYTRRECQLEKTGYTTASPAPEVPRCDDIADARERVVAYDVTYQYHGREFRIRMPHDPGEQMAVNVDVRPSMPEGRPAYSIPRYRGPY